MPATQTDLTGENAIEQGSDWAHGWAVTVDGTPIDETWTARSQVRKTKPSGTVLHQFNAEVTTEGYVILAVAAGESTPFTWRTGVYDVEVVNADESVTLRVAEGRVSVDAEVTR